MPIGLIFQGVNVTREQYDQVSAIVAPGNKRPAGMLYHAGGFNKDGVVVIETWESKEVADKFFQDTLGAALTAAGITVKPEFFEVFNILD